jgi:hypothetical protein
LKIIFQAVYNGFMQNTTKLTDIRMSSLGARVITLILEIAVPLDFEYQEGKMTRREWRKFWRDSNNHVAMLSGQEQNKLLDLMQAVSGEGFFKIDN